MSFFAACGLLSLLAMAWLTRPLWRQSGAASVALGLLPVLCAAGGYFWQGSWRIERLITESRLDPQAAQARMIQSMVQGLAHRLEKQPEDLEGWAMLGRSYFVLQRHAEAADAYARANALSGQSNADFLVGEAENRALSLGRELAGQSRELFERALAVEPDHPRALWFAGLAAVQAGDRLRARRHWQRLLKQDLPDSFRAELKSRLDALNHPRN